MEVTPEELQKRIQELSDDELLVMVNDDPSQYVPEAISFATAEVARRGLTGDDSPAKDPQTMADSLVRSAKVGAKAVGEAMRPGIYHAAGQKAACPHCGNDHFSEQSVLLNTRGLTFFKLDWLNKGATALICSECGFIQWFSRAPKREFSVSQED
jgi:predicted nucleic-acid-binding Zn-ribbon protein